MKTFTKWEVYDKLQDEFFSALPKIAKECDVDIEEAHCDKFHKDYNKFHEVEHEEFEMFKDLKNIFKYAQWHGKVDCVFDITKVIKILTKYGIKVNIQPFEELQDNFTKSEIKLIKENQKVKKDE